MNREDLDEVIGQMIKAMDPDCDWQGAFAGTLEIRITAITNEWEGWDDYHDQGGSAADGCPGS